MTEPTLHPVRRLADGFTLELTHPEPPGHVFQGYDAVVLDALYDRDEWIGLHLSAPPEPDPERPYAAQEDSLSILLTPEEAEALAEKLRAYAAIARANRDQNPEG